MKTAKSASSLLAVLTAIVIALTGVAVLNSSHSAEAAPPEDLKGYEGQPGNQGGPSGITGSRGTPEGLKGLVEEGHPGNNGGPQGNIRSQGTPERLKDYQGQPSNFAPPKAPTVPNLPEQSAAPEHWKRTLAPELSVRPTVHRKAEPSHPERTNGQDAPEPPGQANSVVAPGTDESLPTASPSSDGGDVVPPAPAPGDATNAGDLAVGSAEADPLAVNEPPDGQLVSVLPWPNPDSSLVAVSSVDEGVPATAVTESEMIVEDFALAEGNVKSGLTPEDGPGPQALSSPLFIACLILMAAIGGLFLVQRRPRARIANATPSMPWLESLRRQITSYGPRARGACSAVGVAGKRCAGAPADDAYGPSSQPAKSGASTGKRVCVAADDIAEGISLAQELSAEGLDVVAIAKNGDVSSELEGTSADIVLVDQSANQFPALSALEKLRRRTTVPIILLLHTASPRDRMWALQMGADDCLSKPVDICEVTARIDAVLRRTHSAPKLHQVIRLRDLEIDLINQTARQNGNHIKLTATEWRLLRFLVLNADRIITKDEILTTVWGREYNDADAYLRVWIPRLRKKLEGTEAADLIKTVNGMGYLMDLRHGSSP